MPADTLGFDMQDVIFWERDCAKEIELVYFQVPEGARDHTRRDIIQTTSV